MIDSIQMDPKQLALALYVASALMWLKFIRHGRPVEPQERFAWDMGIDATLQVLRWV